MSRLFVNIIYFYNREEVKEMSTELKYRVRAALALRGKTQSWLAQELNIHPGQLSRIINGRDNTVKHILRIKEFLNIE